MRGIIFEENYLEFIYLRSREESLNNQIQLYRRAEWQQSGACPYGIGLRGVVSPEDRELFWEYRPPYRPTGSILIHKFHESDPSYPLIFVVESTPERPLDSMKPIKWNKDETFLSLLRHRSKTTKIADLEIRCTSRKNWPLPFPVNNLSVVSGAPKFSSVLKLDGNIGQEAIEASALVTLIPST